MFGGFAPSALQVLQYQRSPVSQSTERISPHSAQTVITTGSLPMFGSSSSVGCPWISGTSQLPDLDLVFVCVRLHSTGDEHLRTVVEV